MDEAKILVDFLLEDLELALRYTSYSVLAEQSPIVFSLYEDLKIIRSFLKRKQAPFDQKRLQYFFITEIRNVVLKMLVDIDPYIINFLTKDEGNFGTEIGSLFLHSPELCFRAKQIDLFKTEILGVHNDALFNSSMKNKDVGEVSVEVLSRTRNSVSFLREEKMVGLDDEATALLERLTGREQMELEVISLVGTAGIGKTTMAKRLYNDPLVVHQFHVRGWTTCGLDPLHPFKVNNDALHNILCCIIEDKESVDKMTLKQMRDKLFNCLKGKRYLIVIDGIENGFSRNAIDRYFPNDCVGSKILMTSRSKEEFLKVNPSSSPQVLRFLSQNESWSLFDSKVFTDKSCPFELMEVGKEIASKCGGLPFAIVVLAGVVKKDMSQEWWMHVAEDLSSCVRGEEEQFVDILAVAYEHLPDWLKPCLLYLASFPKGSEIPVKKLVRSWIAGRLIAHNGEKKLEDVAEDYLSYLVDRSLVIVSKRRSNGGIKTCYIHDVLWDLCVKKAKDNILLDPVCIYGQTSLFSAADGQTSRFSVDFTSASLSYEGVPDRDPPFFNPFKDLMIFFEGTESKVTKLLTVLDFENIILKVFPEEILLIVHLKYLSLNIPDLRKLPLLSSLWNLETFILVTEKRATVTLPQDIWKMVKLRHLHVSGELDFENACSSSSTASMLFNLQTISKLCHSSSIQDILARMPNLINLGCHLNSSDSAKDKQLTWVPKQNKESAKNVELLDLSSLKLLETVKFDYQTSGLLQFCIPEPSRFPPNLKKLTLIGIRVDWKEMSTIGRLPNLEVLKIKYNIFDGPRWETSDEGFCRLKFLKLSRTNLQQWIASSSSFPCLEHLVLHRCLVLEEIPSSIGYIHTLQMIEVCHSSASAADSARQIQESQKYMRNELEVIIQPLFEVE